MDYYEIEIPNWDKYQVRKDLKSMNFIRIQSHIFSDQKFMQLSSSAMLVWFYLLTECGRRMTGQLQVFNKQVTTFCKLRTSKVQSSVSELEQLQMVRVVSRHESVPRVEKSIVKKSIVEESRAIEPAKKKQPREKPWLTADFTAQIVAAWNATCAPSCPAIKGFNERRKAALKKQAKDWSIDQFQDLFTKVAQSDFLSGRVKEWRADFDWVFKGNNTLKILEGSYQNHESQGSHAKVMQDVFEEWTQGIEDAQP